LDNIGGGCGTLTGVDVSDLRNIRGLSRALAFTRGGGKFDGNLSPHTTILFAVSKQTQSTPVTAALITAARRLRAEAGRLRFEAPVTHVYNPLIYAWAPYEAYLRKFSGARQRVVFLGMNPGPFGMAQTGVPFGEVAAVRDWLKIEAPVGKPEHEHPRRPIAGFACARSEVSGRRLWGLFAERFATPKQFFAEHIVLNYCPLAFLETGGRNRTPDQLSASKKAALFAACDRHLLAVVAALQPEWLVGVGEFAAKRGEHLFPEGPLKIGRIQHPSPANPAANRDWPALAAAQLQKLGVWD
jgi:single-strand selective monofunctional uracil DNA glycosylase